MKPMHCDAPMSLYAQTWIDVYYCRVCKHVIIRWRENGRVRNYVEVNQ